MAAAASTRPPRPQTPQEPAPGGFAPRAAARGRQAAQSGAQAASVSAGGAWSLARRRKPRTVAGFLGGMLLWALALQLIRNGPTGPAKWFAAKFWNDTGQGCTGGLQHGSSYQEIPGGAVNAPYPGPPAKSTAPSTVPIPGVPVIPPSAYPSAPGVPVRPM